jgi:predicted  nucleic acid-binding Zn-ribbon protein
MAEKDKEREGCGRCNAPVTSKDKGVQCEICEVWYHSKCQGINDETYKVLQKEQTLHWYCKGCEKGIAKMIETITKVQKKQEKLEEDMQKMAKKIDDMKGKMEISFKEVNKEINKMKSDLEKICY